MRQLHLAGKLVLLALLMPLITACALKRNAAIVQFSTINALAAGAYDGEIPVSELLAYGDLGLGTFDRLNGEMIVDQGRVWQVLASGEVLEADQAWRIPYATIVKFKPHIKIPIIDPTHMTRLQDTIDRLVPNKRKICAFRFKGILSFIRTRSVPAQKPPYPPLAEVVSRDQIIFERHEVAGVMVGFRMPGELAGVSVPGYHMHMIAGDRRFGGHVLDVSLKEGMLEIAPTNQFMQIIPLFQEIPARGKAVSPGDEL